MAANAERRAPGRPLKEARHHAREAAVQMLYQWEVGRVSMHEVARTFWTERAGDPDGANGDVRPLLSPELQAFATRLANGVAGSLPVIDPMIAESAEHWRIERMNVLDRLILRLAVYEFLHEAETPRRVAINEALELARTFSTDEAVRFINGILDAIRKKLETEA